MLAVKKNGSFDNGDLVSYSLAKLAYYSVRVLVYSFIYFIYQIVSVNRNSLNSFFPIMDAFYSFLSKTSIKMLKRRGKSEYLCLLPDLREKVLSFIIKYDVTWRFFIDVLYWIEEVPFYS